VVSLDYENINIKAERKIALFIVPVMETIYQIRVPEWNMLSIMKIMNPPFGSENTTYRKSHTVRYFKLPQRYG
jgi:predicted RNA methylase